MTEIKWWKPDRLLTGEEHSALDLIAKHADLIDAVVSENDEPGTRNKIEWAFPGHYDYDHHYVNQCSLCQAFVAATIIERLQGAIIARNECNCPTSILAPASEHCPVHGAPKS